MRLGFFTNAYRNFPLHYALESIARHGYSGIELWVSPYDPPEKWEEIRRQVADFGLPVYGISAHLDFVAPEPKRTQEIERFLKALEIARLFGVKTVFTASGGLYKDRTDAEQRTDFLDAMRIIGPAAKRFGLRVGLEPEPEKWLCSADQFRRLMEEELDPEVFGAIMDVAHAFGVGETPVSYLKKLSPYLIHIHLDDVNAQDFPHRHLIPGEGDIDYPSFFTALSEVGYQGWLSVELNRHTENPDQAAELAYKFLQRYRNYWDGNVDEV